MTTFFKCVKNWHTHSQDFYEFSDFVYMRRMTHFAWFPQNPNYEQTFCYKNDSMTHIRNIIKFCDFVHVYQINDHTLCNKNYPMTHSEDLYDIFGLLFVHTGWTNICLKKNKYKKRSNDLHSQNLYIDILSIFIGRCDFL